MRQEGSPSPKHSALPPAGQRPVGGTGVGKVELPQLVADGKGMSGSVSTTSLNSLKLPPQGLRGKTREVWRDKTHNTCCLIRTVGLLPSGTTDLIAMPLRTMRRFGQEALSAFAKNDYLARGGQESNV